MTMLLLAKVAKMAWLDEPRIKDSLALELLEIANSPNISLQLVGLSVINQLIDEMAYLTKMKNLTINRRISLSFRDSALFNIYQHTLQFLNSLAQHFRNFNFEFLRGSSSEQTVNLLRITQVAMEIYSKCLNFDFIAILLNETLEEPSQTSLPPAWVKSVENPDTINTLFFLSSKTSSLLGVATQNSDSIQNQESLVLLQDIVFNCFKCLGEYANLRQTFFTDKDSKNNYSRNFLSNLTQMLDSRSSSEGLSSHQLILSKPNLFREFLRIINKFQMNFGLRSLVNAEQQQVVGVYIQSLFNYCLFAFNADVKCKSKVMDEMMAWINLVWTRFSFESNTFQSDQTKVQVEQFIKDVVRTQID